MLAADTLGGRKQGGKREKPMMLAKWRNSRSGMSLVEVAIAVAVISIVVTGILGLYYQSVLVSKKMNQLFIATNLAKSRLERLRNIAFDSLPQTAESDTLLDKEGNSIPDGDFQRNTSVSTNYNGDPDLTQVTVTVDYKMKGAFTGNPVTLTTVFVNE